MPRSLSASDRTSLIRLASSLPINSPERKAILAGLQKSAGMSSSQIKSKLKNPIRLTESDGTNRAFFDKASGKVYLHIRMVEEGGDSDLVLETTRSFKTPKEFQEFLATDDGDYSDGDNKNWKEVWEGDPSDLEDQGLLKKAGLVYLDLQDLDEWEISSTGGFRWAKWDNIKPLHMPSKPGTLDIEIPIPPQREKEFPGQTHWRKIRRSVYPGWVFYRSTDSKFFILVNAKKKQAFKRSLEGSWSESEAFLSAKEESIRDIIDGIQKGFQDWTPLPVR